MYRLENSDQGIAAGVIGALSAASAWILRITWERRSKPSQPQEELPEERRHREVLDALKELTEAIIELRVQVARIR